MRSGLSPYSGVRMSRRPGRPRGGTRGLNLSVVANSDPAARGSSRAKRPWQTIAYGVRSSANDLSTEFSQAKSQPADETRPTVAAMGRGLEADRIERARLRRSGVGSEEYEQLVRFATERAHFMATRRMAETPAVEEFDVFLLGLRTDGKLELTELPTYNCEGVSEAEATELVRDAVQTMHRAEAVSLVYPFHSLTGGRLGTAVAFLTASRAGVCRAAAARVESGEHGPVLSAARIAVTADPSTRAQLDAIVDGLR